MINPPNVQDLGVVDGNNTVDPHKVCAPRDNRRFDPWRISARDGPSLPYLSLESRCSDACRRTSGLPYTTSVELNHESRFFCIVSHNSSAAPVRILLSGK